MVNGQSACQGTWYSFGIPGLLAVKLHPSISLAKKLIDECSL